MFSTTVSPRMWALFLGGGRCIGSYLPLVGSYFLAAAHEILVVCVWGTWFPAQGSNPGPLHYECGVLATRPPGKSSHISVITIIKHFSSALGVSSRNEPVTSAALGK